MTVGELIKLLQEEDPGRLVVMAKDGEGNSYSPLRSDGPFWTGAYRAETTWYGEAGFEEMTPEMEATGRYSEEDVITDGVPALILRPTN